MRPEDLEQEYRALRIEFDAGRLSEEDFAEKCVELMAQDDRGQWWCIDTSGQLLCHDDARGTWSPRRPGAIGDGDVRTGAPASTSAPDTPAAPRPDPTGPASGVIGLAIVFFASLVVSRLSWDALAVIPNAINAVIPTGSCTNLTPGSVGMYVCSGLVGLRVVFGSLVLAVGLILLRKPIAAIIGKINLLMPADYRAVLPAVVGAVFFAVVWAGSHADTGGLWGFLPHWAFPAVVGLMVHAVMTHGPAFMDRHARFFKARDQLPKVVRWMIVILTPTLVSLLITYQDRVSNEALKQQLVVIVGMAVGILILTPRGGNLADLHKKAGRATT